eukprot:TRINITY_DN7378_c0_g1_i1.p1 TRINITY_DN7378_c0_g1~~TRINITY_DN7378_c0_g1_i1.p1  ORF type:complete len:219 (+),score=40.21 TRINITY_DN7378_c0_g1_i1:230-886(+)
MDTLSSGVWNETLKNEKKSASKWHEQRKAAGGSTEDLDGNDELEEYERMLKRMPQQNRVSLRSLQVRKGGLSRKIGSWADKETGPPRTPSQDVRMIRSKMPPLVNPITGPLDGYNAHPHMPGYTGFVPGKKCKEYLMLKRADKETAAQLGDLGLRYKVKMGPPNMESLKTSNQVKDNFKGKLRDPDLADWANHRKKSEITEYVRMAIKLHVNIKASGH